MKEYYVIEISKTADKKSPSIYTYSTLDEAEASFHKKLGGVMSNTDFLEESICVMDSDMLVYMSKHFIRETVPITEAQ